MPAFDYKAMQPDGATVEGQLDAAGRAEAYQGLEQRGLRILRLSEASTSDTEPTVAIQMPWRRGVSRKALGDFTRQLSSLLSAGVPLARALRLLAREASEPVAREHWQGIHDMVVDGASLAGAMSQEPDTFPRVYVAMVQAGETGGFLDLVLQQIADFQDREKELKAKVVSALIYPAVLAGLSAAVVVFLLTFFIPTFKGIFADFGAALPVLTRGIVAASEGIRTYGLAVAAALAILAWAARRWFRSDAGRRRWEHFALQVPVVGPLAARFAMVRFCRMLGTLTGAGVPLINALRVARESIGNQILIDAVSSAIERVQQGERLGVSLGDCRELFPRSVVEMISVSEQASRLDKELVRLAATAEGDLDRQLRAAVALAEPAVLFLMAAFIGVIVVGMVLPIFTIQEYIR